MKKYIKCKAIKHLVFLFIFLFINYENVKANVICNDGWLDSSCIVSRSGCCSHHGGVRDNSYYFYENNSLNDEEIIDNIIHIIFFIIVAFIIIKIIYNCIIKPLNNKNDETYSCGECGNVIDKTDKTCPYCGTEFLSYDDENEEKVYICSKCGNKVDQDSNECPHCGSKFI